MDSMSRVPFVLPTDRRPRLTLASMKEKVESSHRLTRLREFLSKDADVSYACLTEETPQPLAEADLLVVVGGDGSLLRSARLMENQQRPVLGINTGKLGFLADISLEKFPDAWQEVREGRSHAIQHIMLDSEIVREGEAIARRLGLNETSILAGTPFRILDIDLYIDAEWAATYSCDGLIVGTPVGSTAHSLSAGGPILRKDLDAFVISPISAHTLSNRPLVDSAEHVFELSVERPNPGTSVVMDGQIMGKLRSGDRVRVRRAAQTFKLLEVEGHNYYRTLREKLGWSGRIAHRS